MVHPQPPTGLASSKSQVQTAILNMFVHVQHLLLDSNHQPKATAVFPPKPIGKEEGRGGGTLVPSSGGHTGYSLSCTQAKQNPYMMAWGLHCTWRTPFSAVARESRR